MRGAGPIGAVHHGKAATKDVDAGESAPLKDVSAFHRFQKCQPQQ